MEDIEDFLALILFLLLLGAIFVGGFYWGYRYRDNLSLQRQKKYPTSRLANTSYAPAPTSADPTEEEIGESADSEEEEIGECIGPAEA
jgi:predicted permease